MNEYQRIFTDEEIENFHKYIELIDKDGIVLSETNKRIAKTKQLIMDSNNIKKEGNKEDIKNI